MWYVETLDTDDGAFYKTGKAYKTERGAVAAARASHPAGAHGWFRTDYREGTEPYARRYVGEVRDIVPGRAPRVVARVFH